MAHNIMIRGFDDQVYTKLGDMANQKGVSINSIVKDAVDKWLKQQSQVPKKHHLIIYSESESMTGLLKSMDRLAKEAELFRCFCGPQDNPSMSFLSKMKWYDGTVEPYYSSTNDKKHAESQTPDQTSIVDYCGKVVENIAKKANGKPVCCMDFLIDDITNSSLKDALALEKLYDSGRIPGLMYCTYKTETLVNAEIRDIIELFDSHDEVFIVREDEVYKLHITKENVHKLFLN
ncbi:MAG TPA: hypothetical protein VER14_06620 [Phototrophicaceae bacterium]|nr:hypothetical protein [Phototrophicaceae bacterium]